METNVQETRERAQRSRLYYKTYYEKRPHYADARGKAEKI